MAVIKKTKTISTEKMDLLLSNFAGEQVEIVVDKNLDTPAATEEGHIEMVSIPLILQGYLTDHDDTFIYLGLSPNQINQCVQKDFVVHISILDESMIETEEKGKIPAGKFN